MNQVQPGALHSHGALASVAPIQPARVNTTAKAIVLVDDEPTYTELLATPLAEALGCRVYTFTRPLDALHALAGINPSVIVTDYFMPEIDGIQFIRKATPIVPQARFLMMSGQDLTSHREELAALPALKGSLAKPFGWKRLAEEISRVAESGVDRAAAGHKNVDTP